MRKQFVFSDINQFRLDLAKKLGADETILIDLKNFNVKNVVEQVKKHFNGNGVDITFECTGNEGSTQVAIYSTDNGGKVALVGLGPLEVKAPLVNASLREVDIIGVCRFRNW
jgi:L-iditol 2-dehydrogenase